MVISDTVIRQIHHCMEKNILSKQNNTKHDRRSSKTAHTVTHYLLLTLQLSIRQKITMFDFELQIWSSTGCWNCEKPHTMRLDFLLKAKRSTCTCQKDKVEIFFFWLNITSATVLITRVKSTEPKNKSIKAKCMCAQRVLKFYVRMYHFLGHLHNQQFRYLQNYHGRMQF